MDLAHHIRSCRAKGRRNDTAVKRPPSEVSSAQVISQVSTQEPDFVNSRSLWQVCLFIGDPLKSFSVSVSAGFPIEESCQSKRPGRLRLLRASPAAFAPHHKSAGQVFALSSQLITVDGREVAVRGHRVP